MEAIFHEKQEGSLCAQHCLNALLQGSYFTAVDLAELARQLDDEERSHMAEAGVQSDEYRRFLEQPSSNFDDSGFFSIQVIQKAVKVWGLETLPFNSQDPIAIQARNDPTTMAAYICNFREHWFAIRRIGNQWFNLNSLLTSSELISNTYLSMFLTQLQQEGYSIFIILGQLPECEADQLLKLVPAVQPVKPRLITENRPNATDEPVGGQDDELSKVLKASRQMADSEDSALQMALAMSMQGMAEDNSLAAFSHSTNTKDIPQPNLLVGATPGASCSSSKPTINSSPSYSSPSTETLSTEELRLKRLAYLDRQQQGNTNPPQDSGSIESESTEPDDCQPSEPDLEDETEPEFPQRRPASEMTEEEMIQEAIKLSMQSS